MTETERPVSGAPARWRLRTAEARLDVSGLRGRLVNQAAERSLRHGGSLMIQSLVIETLDARQRLVLITADIIWFSDDGARALRRAVAERACCDEPSVALAASHTHGTPQPDRRFRLGEYDPDFERRITEAVLATVETALASSPREASIAYAASCLAQPSAVNRRRQAWYLKGNRLGRRAQNLPNRSAPCDNAASVLAFRDAGGQPVAVVVHFACHPVSDPDGTLGADFPGAMREALRSQLRAGTLVGFLQGFCGDVRPNLIHRPRGLKDHALELVIGSRFRPSQNGDSAQLGKALGAAAERALAAAVGVEGSVLGALREALPVRGASGTALERDLDVTVWRIGSLAVVFASGEMLSALDHPDPRILSVGYANGMVGYIAPEPEYARGGYEIDGFLPRFGLPERVAPDTAAQYRMIRDRLLARAAGAAGHERVKSPAPTAS